MDSNLLKKQFFKKNIYVFLVFLITLILFVKNYKQGTYLSGWDNLQTELNPSLGVKRAFFSVWEEYQSFGLVAGMAHAADLVRAVFLWLVAFVLPQSMIRYFYHFLMWLLGGWGALKLFHFIFSQDKNNKNTNNWSAFLGCLFYLFNLGTTQIFFLPFEPFSTFFAFLPWGIWIFFKISNLKYQISRKDIFLFFLINFLGTPSFYTQQLFVTYIIILFCLSAAQLISYRENVIATAHRWLFFFGLIFLINSFWLLPQIYFIKTSSNVVYEAKINQLATENTYFQNKEKGNLKNFLQLKGFYYDLTAANRTPLFVAWQGHFENKFFSFFLFLLAAVAILGLFKKNSFRLHFLLILFPISIFLLSDTFPFSLIDKLIRQKQLLNQIFRSPFTKFIIPYSLVYSYFFAQGLRLLDNRIKVLKTRTIKQGFKLGILIILIGYSLPLFQGYFISQEMKVKIPKVYLELIDYFKTQNKNQRITLLPDYTFWGWFFHRWGYNGSGFLWYGIEQPIVSRTFDVWSDKSEGYFWEAKGALEAEDVSRFEKVLEKYQINYIILDYTLLPVTGSMKGLQYDRLENILNGSGKISLLRKWKNLALYKVNQEKTTSNFIWATDSLTNIGPKIKLTDKDTAYEELGNYYTNSNQPSIIFPFLDLTTTTRLKNRNWEIVEEDNQFIVKSQLDFNIPDYQLTSFNNRYQAVLYQNEKVVSYSVTFQPPKIFSHQLTIAFSKKLVEKITPQNLSETKTPCFRNTTCFGFWLPHLPQRYAYLIKIKNKNYSGNRLFFYVLDDTKKQAFIEEKLKKDVEYFILPPKYQYGLGYSFIFHENSYENLKSKNDLTNIEIYLFPYENLKNLKLIKPTFSHFDIHLKEKKSLNTKKIYYFTYRVIVDNDLTRPSNNSFLILSQSFHLGWNAYWINCQNNNLKCQISTFFPFIFGQELKNHVLVNNWANGWEINSEICNVEHKTCQIVILFWPQYLEFLGFGLMISSFVILLKSKRTKKNKLTAIKNSNQKPFLLKTLLIK